MGPDLANARAWIGRSTAASRACRRIRRRPNLANIFLFRWVARVAELAPAAALPLDRAPVGGVFYRTPC